MFISNIRTLSIILCNWPITLKADILGTPVKT